MSSFRRRVATTVLPGTRPSPYNSLTLLSSGLSSLDDLLGGGVPLSSSLLIQADSHTSYAELLLKFWIAQGLECKQDVVVVASGLEGGPEAIASSLMEVDGGQVVGDEEDDEEAVKARDEKMKIAFRYEGMKQHAVTIAAPTRVSTSLAPHQRRDSCTLLTAPKGNEADTYCTMFDLTTPRQLRASDRQRLTLVDVDTLGDDDSATDVYDALLARLEHIITTGGYA